MKIYVSINDMSGKANQPFFMESESACKEYIIKSCLSDNSNTMVALAKHLHIVELADFEFNESSFCFSSGVVTDFEPVLAIAKCNVNSFTVYDVIKPILDSYEEEKNVEDSTR